MRYEANKKNIHNIFEYILINKIDNMYSQGRHTIIFVQESILRFPTGYCAQSNTIRASRVRLVSGS
jgi:hypothetical protein